MAGATEPESDWGIIWLVDDNDEQRESFAYSLRSARYHMPDRPMAVMTVGGPLETECRVIPLQTAARKWAAKFAAWQASPFATTVFLDNDTIVLRDFGPVVAANRYVSAMPYPNFHVREEIAALRGTALPERWRNVNSGVVVFNRDFMQDYAAMWRDLGDRVPILPGKDQCLFSACLAATPRAWRPVINLQVPASPRAVEFLRRSRGVPREPAMGEIPLALLCDAFVFHYTGFAPTKRAYRDLFRQTFGLDALHANPPRRFEDLSVFPPVTLEELGPRLSAIVPVTEPAS